MRIGLTTADSQSDPTPEPFPPGAPNVVVVVLDDLGFAQLGCFGSDIATPHLDRLAARGLRFTNFHTTAVCSPTRACLLTGRNHHRVGMGMLPDLPMNFPGYSGRIPQTAGTLAAVLRDAGWATYAVGKWHLNPRDTRSPAGPFDHWPLGLGFERYYGFLGGDSNHWTPELVRDNSYVTPPRSPEEGYHLTEDLADQAVAMVRDLRASHPDRPFFLWFATGATHSPHHAPPEWIERYAGAFDDGWDVWREATLDRQKALGVVPEHVELSDRPDWVPAWDTLSADARRVYARMMEVYAGFLSHTDHHIGRVLDAIDEAGEADRTIVVVVSDNGASGEGGEHGSTNELRFIGNLPESLEHNLEHYDELGGWRSYGHYPWGWAFAGNTPLRRWKRYTHEGGVRDPLIVSWPAGITDAGGLRDQYCHAIDIAPTLIDCLGVAVPERLGGVEQMSLDGTSLRQLFDEPAAPDVRTTQYYECWGSRAIYRDGWKAVTDHVNQLTPAEREQMQGSSDLHVDRWQLFHVAEDFGENHDLADEHPDLLRELIELWYLEAGRNDVLPLDDGQMGRWPHLMLPWNRHRPRSVHRPGDQVHEDVGPIVAGGFSVTAVFSEPYQAGASGLLFEQGDWTNGWAWFALDGELRFVYNHVAERIHRVVVPEPVGARSVTVTGRPTGADRFEAAVYVDGDLVRTQEVASMLPFRWTPNGAFFRVGFGRPFPVVADYEPPFPFDGPLDRLVMEVGEPRAPDPDALLELVMRHQ